MFSMFMLIHSPDPHAKDIVIRTTCGHSVLRTDEFVLYTKPYNNQHQPVKNPSYPVQHAEMSLLFDDRSPHIFFPDEHGVPVTTLCVRHLRDRVHEVRNKKLLLRVD